MSIVEIFTKIEHKLRPVILKLFKPEIFISLYTSSRNSYLKKLSNANVSANLSECIYEQSLFKNRLKFRNDLGNAAGFDKDGSLLEFNYKIGAGFSVVGTVLSEEYSGNIHKSIFGKSNPWTPLPNSGSAINSLGLPSKGIDIAVKNIKKFKDRVKPKDFPIGVSIMGHPLHKDSERKLKGISECVDKALEVADFIEINESCPNTEHNDDQSSMLARVTEVIELRDSKERYVPVLVKLGDLGDAEFTIKFLSKLKVDGIVIVNTQKNYSTLLPRVSKRDQKLYDYYTENYQGGVSGAVIKDFSFEQAKKAASVIDNLNLDMIVVHTGGIATKDDIQNSRKIAKDIVCLREWYTGLMEAMGSNSWNKVYSKLI